MKIRYFLQDNKAYFLFIIGLLVILLYYLYFWNKAGRDPEPGIIAPIITPPADVSPAAMRFVDRMGFDPKTLTCAVVNMAVKGVFDIMEDGGGQYALRKKPLGNTVLSVEEVAVYNALPVEGLFNVSNSNHEDVQRAMVACKNVLSELGEGKFFVTNGRYTIRGAAISVLVWLGIFAMDRNIVLLIVAGVILILLNVGFYRLLKALTIPGRGLIDRIEGFRMFLSMTEKDRLNALYPGGRTPRLFESYLPYALALGVEQKWAERFSDVLAEAGPEGTSYMPGWYVGSSWSPHHPAQFASSLGDSFSHAVSLAAAPPGSSPGFQ